MSASSRDVGGVERMPGRLEQRRERILKEAEALFLKHGYAGASVNEVVRRAGGSLATLYSEFGSKEHLFAEIMRRRATSVFDSDVPPPTPSGDLRAGLLALATRLLERILKEDSLAMYRICVSEGPRLPDLRKAILEVSLPTFLDRLGVALTDLGVVADTDRSALAEEFLSLVHGQLVFRAACGGEKTITARQKTVQAERAVDAFLLVHGCAVRSKKR
jgi:AcrR family transcriptional regulator